jgi:hypothetical protein
MQRLIALLLVLLCGPSAADVVRIHGLDPAQLGELRQHHDFWGLDRRAGAAVFWLEAGQRQQLVAEGFRVEPDPERQAEFERWQSIDRSQWPAGSPGTIPGFGCYRTVSQTHADLQALALQFPGRAEWRDIGDSWQTGAGSAPGDSIFALVITNPDSPHPRAPFVLMAAQHARELATAEIATRFAELLLINPDDDPDLAWLADHREIHIIAQQNPDGRRQVEAGDSFWRKNHNETACTGGNEGVDLNRNSTVLWGDFSSSSACSDSYRGGFAGSEPETTAVEDYLATVFAPQRPGGGLNDPAPADAVGLFISLHSFGELVLFPWEGLAAGNQNNAPNHDGLAILGRRFGFETGYAVGRWQLLGPAGGTMVDYAYGEFGVAAYTFEVGDTFTQSCSSFESNVWPVNREALKLAAKAARRPYLEPAGPTITALSASLDQGAIRLVGNADDGRYFRGGVTEPPAQDPVSDVVEIRVALGAPEDTGAPAFAFAPATPAVSTSFDVRLPAGVTLPSNGRLFVTAVDSQGQTGLPRLIEAPDLVFNDGFES